VISNHNASRQLTSTMGLAAAVISFDGVVSGAIGAFPGYVSAVPAKARTNADVIRVSVWNPPV
jgi:hypothetical protein